MSNSPSDPNWRSLAIQGESIAREIEMGQAEAPLTELFASLQKPTEQLNIFVLISDSKLRQAFLACLCGTRYPFMSVKVAKEAGFLELSFQERGYALEIPGQGRREFEQIDSLMEALEGADLVLSGDADSWMDPVQMHVESNTAAAGLRLLIPDRVSSLQTKPGLVTQIASRSHCMMCAANETLDESLVQVVTAQLPFAAIVGGSSVNIRPPRFVRHLLPECRVGDDQEEVHIPSWMVNPEDSYRRAILLDHRVREIQRAVDMLADRIDSDLRQVRVRQSNETRREKSLDPRAIEGGLRQSVDKAKKKLADGTAELINGIREINRKETLPEGAIHNVVTNVALQLQLDDLARKQSGKSIELHLADEPLVRTRRQLAGVLRKRFSEDLALVRDQTVSMRAKIEDALSETGLAASVNLPNMESRAWWNDVKKQLKLNVNYRGELAKRGWLQRLGEGRKVVFLLLMSLSLVGSFAGFRVRNVGFFGFVFLLVFIISVFWTFKSWKTEEGEQLNKELEKAKDTMKRELERLVSEIQREKLNAIASYVDSMRKQVMEQIERFSVEAQARIVLANNRQKENLRGVLDQIAARSRNLQNLLQRANRLQRDTAEMERKSKSLLLEIRE